MATQWQGPHFIVILAASGLAFAGGYTMAGRSRPAPSAPPPVTNTSNGIAEPPGIPGFGTNGQAPPRGRPDENELIARNAEPEDGSQPQSRGTPPRGEQPDGRGAGRGRGTREERQDDLPPEQPYEEDQGYDPQGE